MVHGGVVEVVALDDPVGIARAAAVHAHLEVLIVDLDDVEAELDIAENGELAGGLSGVLNPDIPELALTSTRDEELLGGLNALVGTFEDRIG